jgi:hypothetical protein
MGATERREALVENMTIARIGRSQEFDLANRAAARLHPNGAGTHAQQDAIFPTLSS